MNRNENKNKTKKSNHRHVTFCLNRLHGNILPPQKKKTNRKFNN